jgi:steroid delta-isomerase-like uncharacterized protein
MTAKEIALRFIDAHNRHDVEAMLDCLDADMKMLDPAAPIPLHTKDDVRTLYRSIFTAFPDIRFDVTGIITEDDLVFAALHTTGQEAGDFMGRDMRGKPVDVFEAMFARAAGEKITWAQFYSDTATLQAQLS